MYAVIKTGGKQYRVAPEDVIKIEKIEGEVGASVEFADVLLVAGDGDAQIGTPVVSGATVAGEVVEQGRAKKIIVFKKKRRKNYRRKKGHRQELTTVRITDIVLGGKSAPKKPKAEAKKPEPKGQSDDDLEPLFERPQGEPDDLSRISGVGPVIVGKLHQLGITKFEQIANFTAEDIEKVDAVLNFKGRITRDAWVEQAGKLASGEEG